MRTLLAVALIGGTAIVAAQERKIPKDSELVSIRGCANNRTFIVAPRSEDQPGTLSIAPGRRFRMNGKKEILADIRARERSMLEVTGLIKKADVNPPQGIPVLGGRVRIGGAVPRDGISNPARDPAYNQSIIDVESWRVVPGDCD
jgi:hypothetical protein